MAEKFRVASVAIVVTDRKRSARWFKSKLGMSILSDEPEHWTTVGYKGGIEIHLCESANGKMPKSEKGNSGILLTVKGDLQKAASRLRRRGVKFSLSPVKQPWGWMSAISDPDGNEFWLVPA